MVPDDVIFMVASVWQFSYVAIVSILGSDGREGMLFLGNIGFHLTRHSASIHWRNAELAANDTCPRGRCAGVRDFRSLPLLRSPLLPHVPPERARGRVRQAGLCATPSLRSPDVSPGHVGLIWPSCRSLLALLKPAA